MGSSASPLPQRAIALGRLRRAASLLFFGLAFLGLLASIALHVASFFPCRLPGQVLALIPGLFLVWLAAAVTVERRVRDRGARAQHAAFVQGAPAWWRKGMYAVFGIAILSTIITCVIDWTGGPKELGPIIVGETIQAPSTSLRFFTGVTMSFYALAALALYPARMLGKDPADGWPESHPRELFFELADRSLNGVRLGQPEAFLRAFGRPDNRWPSRNERYIFRPLGLIVETEKGCVDYLAFVMEDLESLGLEPCRVTILLAGGAPLNLGPETVQGEIVAVLGEPDEHDEDAEERVHTYRKMGFQVELEYAPDGRLRRLNAFRG